MFFESILTINAGLSNINEVKVAILKEVQCNGCAYRSARLFIIAISSHSHKERKQHKEYFFDIAAL